MRILHVTPYFEGAWAYGGIPRAAAATVQGLVARGHRVTVCTTDACRAEARLPAADRQGPARDDAADIRVFPNLSNAAAYHLQFFLPMGLRRYLKARAGDFDIAHLHGCHHVPGSLAARYLRRAGVPYVVTPNGTAPYIERRQTAKRLFDATIGRGMLEGAARIIAVSKAERAQLGEFGVAASSVSVVPNPLDTTEFGDVPRGVFRGRYGIGPDEPVVLYLGKLTPRKRLDTLVEAFAALRRPDARLVIAGNDMGYGRQLQQLIDRFGIRERTLLTGLLPGQTRLEALADADVVAYASELEVFGLVPVEALLCGTPVVVANDNGCGEIIAETGGGLIVPPGEPEPLRQALDQVLGNREHWRRMAAQAQGGAMQFSSERVSADLETLYDEVIAGVREARLSAVV
ncbi:MAG: glycosyltransferase [Acidobacteria bacterium]|nr:glycosyltransferase [Acidobacteriota bacterium]